MSTSCYHCGDPCERDTVHFEDKSFCCHGCKTVYEIFASNGLTTFYELDSQPGISPKVSASKYNYLEDQKIVERLIDFTDDDISIVSFYIPGIHCSSCIWLLENLNQLTANIVSSEVNFNKKTVRIVFKNDSFDLKELVLLLNKIGYDPEISLDDFDHKKNTIDRSLLYKLVIAGFAFGNIMFLSLPEYFEEKEFWIEQYKHLFRWLMLLFSLPVVFYSARDYFSSAIKGLKVKHLTIDVPISLGILALFIRSTVEVIFDLGSGFFDSLTGLVFFLLVGKYFQQKTYAFLSFERDYKSYFPIAVTKINSDKTEQTLPVHEIKANDILLIRNEELIPVDALIVDGNAAIDYSFVTGESKLIHKKPGDQVYAGGKQKNGVLTIQAKKTVNQSELVKLWGHQIFHTPAHNRFADITSSISKKFTVAVLTIATIATAYWLFQDSSKAINVFTAVLIIACPCAIALAAPFTLGNVLRLFGRKKFYLKNAEVIEKLAALDTLVFDKTGTLTSTTNERITFTGNTLNTNESKLLSNVLRASNHPLSRSLYNLLDEHDIIAPSSFKEEVGQGISASFDRDQVKIGSAKYVGAKATTALETAVHVSYNNVYRGKYVFYNAYRKGVTNLFNKLKRQFNLVVLSGDNEGERDNLIKLLPAKTSLIFNQKPEDKLEYIAYHQKEGANVAMIGDGLNDAGALAQSDVGIAISENINVFTPACDAIMDADQLINLATFLSISKQAITVIKWCFVLSLCYNVIGLYFAVTAQLSPVIAAILMPLSSISIVVFTTLATNWICRKIP